MKTVFLAVSSGWAMHMSLTTVDPRTQGARLIGAGLAIVFVAQVLGNVPVATAMALIGWGAIVMMRSGIATVVNLMVYGTLVGYTIGSQSHATFFSPSGMSRLTSIDHTVALLLLAALAWTTLQRATAEVSRNNR